jgi:signal transduction histidine kinase
MSNKIQQNNKERIKMLKSIHLFSAMDESMLLEIAQTLLPVSIIEEQVLFENGDLDYALYLIVEGRVKVHVGSHVYAYFDKNNYIGEYSLLDSSPRSASVTAVEPTQLLRFDQKDFLNLIKRQPDISRLMLQGLVHRLRDYNTLEAELTKKNNEIEKQKNELERQRMELEALNSTKDKFFAIIAHDLKNPFSTVLGISELLAREFESFDPDSLKNFITQIYKYSNNTYNLLENLLQWSMVQTGRMPMRPAIINIMDVIQENVDLLMGNAKQKSIRINNQKCSNCYAYVDVNQITTVVRNLLSNAIKFTSNDGEINIYIKSNNSFWIISVNDNGIGINEKDINRLFLLDSNPTTIGTSQEKGTGLGLILCKEFVERNGGKIWVESKVGAGTTFFFSVPKCEKDT